MNKARLNIVLGVAAAIEFMKLMEKGETMAEAVVRYGEDDKITLAEAQEALEGSKEEKAA